MKIIEMKKILSITVCTFMIMAGIFVSCEVDNYDAPDGTLTGSVIDAVTGKPIITEQPNGFRIRYKEISWGETATDQYLWGKPDGTFNHTKLFAGTYEITAVEGAFITPAPQQVEIKSGGVTTATFTVTPYISFSNVSIVKESATSVKATFTITRNVPDAAPQDYRIFASSKTPYIGTNSGGSEADVSLPPTSFTEADLGKPIEVTLNNYVAGKTYYIRIGARCDNSSNRYNMTEVVTIKM
jgi:hypothetical protein